MTILDKAKFNMQRYCCPIPGKKEGEKKNMEEGGKGEKEKGTAAAKKDLAAYSKNSLYFSNYFYTPGYRERVCLGRQFEYCEEADAIFQKFAGTSARFGDVRRFLVEKTAFPVHAKTLNLLRQDGRITEVEVVEEEEPWWIALGEEMQLCLDEFEEEFVEVAELEEVEESGEEDATGDVGGEDDGNHAGGGEALDDDDVASEEEQGEEKEEGEMKGEKEKKKKYSFYARNLPANHWSSKVWVSIWQGLKYGKKNIRILISERQRRHPALLRPG